MEIQLHTNQFEQLDVPLLVIPVFSDDKKLPSGVDFLSRLIHPSVKDIFSRDDFQAKLNQERIVYTGGEKYPVVAFLGAGKVAEWNLEKARELWGGAVNRAREFHTDRFAVYWDNHFPCPSNISLFFIETVAALMTAEYRLKEFLAEPEEPVPDIQMVHILYPDANEKTDRYLEQGKQLGESVNLTRRLAEYPSNLMSPEKFVEELRQQADKFAWELEILDINKLKSKGLHALLAVAQGSDNAPYLAIARYKPEGAKKTAALVGKGVTFDTGGISIKPSKKMEDMKYDMCGAAAVLGALRAASLTHLPLNVVAAMPLVENMPSGKAIRPGDVVQSYSGKSIEIINTDAEGRLILADALSYVEQNDAPDFMVDLATLTGSVIAALGKISAAVLSTHNELLEALEEAANISGEKIWRLPLWDEYMELMKSKIADIRNVGTKPEAGTITAAMFLKNFVNKTPWAHLDIAGTAYNMTEKTYRPAGATGFGVRLLWHWLNELSH